MENFVVDGELGFENMSQEEYVKTASAAPQAAVVGAVEAASSA